MRKLYLAVHKDGHLTSCSCPFSETGAVSKVIEVEDADYQKALSSEYKTSLFGDGIANEPMPKMEVGKTQIELLEERIVALETLNKK